MKKIACCGIDCVVCEAYLATQSDDDAARAEIAEKWSKMYGGDIKAGDINCDGCSCDENDPAVKLFNYTRNMCEIRKCARGKGLENCAPCDEYACEKLAGIHGGVPEAKANLDELRPSSSGG